MTELIEQNCGPEPFTHCSLITRTREDANCYRVHAKVYATGDAKTVALRLFPDDKERSKGGYKRKNKEKSQMDETTLRKSYQRSRSTATDLCIQKGADQLLTLTTRENIEDFDIFSPAYKLFLRKMRKRYGQRFSYVAVMEYQKRGAIHVHMGVSGYYHWNTVRRAWNQALKHYGLGDGNVDFTNSRKYGHKKWNAKKIAEYICKYITKSDIAEFNKKRYWSGGATTPLVKYMGYIGVGLPMIKFLGEVISSLSRNPVRSIYEFDDRFGITVLTT